MKFKVKCIKPMIINFSMYRVGKDFSFEVGVIYDILIDNQGVRFFIDECYTYPYEISSISNFFTSISE